MENFEIKVFDKESNQVCNVKSIDFTNEIVIIHYNNEADWEPHKKSWLKPVLFKDIDIISIHFENR
uniref:Uncharacterized protein n=1 Tax=viral metagenome TaxID=1070528 RepID=A0A6M3X5E8_9ZZZZ